jgi:prolipoprotein diacylglyceryltransferase
MRQILFYLPFVNIPIYAYGFCAMLGFLFAIVLCARLARKQGIDPNHIFDLGLVALISGILGARILFVIQPTEMLKEPFDLRVFDVFDGNLSIAGMVAGLLAGGLLYAVRKRIRFLKFVHERGPRAWAFFSITAVFAAFLMARLFFCVANRGAYSYQAFEIWRGGLVWYGGLIFGVICGIIFVLIKKLPLRKMADIGAPHIMLGLAFGRVGCFLNGC